MPILKGSIERVSDLVPVYRVEMNTALDSSVAFGATISEALEEAYLRLRAIEGEDPE